MTAERAIELLSDEYGLLNVPFSELDEICRMACDALRLYSHSFQKAYSLNAAIADYYRNLGLPMERLEKLATADKAGRLVILPDVSCTDADGEEALRRAMWDCDYRNNGVTRFAADAIAEKLCSKTVKYLRVETPLGAIIVRPSCDLEHSGVWIDLRRTDMNDDMPLALIEFSSDDTDLPEGQPNIITRVWGNGGDEGYTDRIVHQGIEEYFKIEKETQNEGHIR